MRTISTAVASLLCCFFGTASAGVIKTDIVFVQDYSQSFTQLIPNFANVIPSMAKRFTELGVDARYALVGYQFAFHMPKVLTNFTDAEGLKTAYSAPVSWSTVDDTFFSGRIENESNPHLGQGENAFDGVAVALNGLANFTRDARVVQTNADGSLQAVTKAVSLGPQPVRLDYRNDAVKNVVLFADEPPQSVYGVLPNGERTWFGPNGGAIGQFAVSENALINIFSPIEATSDSAEFYYEPLATVTGGNLFDLNALQNTSLLEDAIEYFVDVKFEELVDVCTGDPLAPGCEDFSPGDISVDPNPVSVPSTFWLIALNTFLITRAFRRVS